MTKLCKFGPDLVYPVMWQEQVEEEYRSKVGEVPNYVTEALRGKKRWRTYSSDGAFSQMNKRDGTYDAFKEDIAMVHFYFDKPSAIEFSRNNRLTFVGFLGMFCSPVWEFL